MERKQELRRQLKVVRDAIPKEVRCEKSRQISERLVNTSWYRNTPNILAYSAIQSEVDLSVFCEKAWADGKRLYFPKVLGKEMEFYRIDSWHALCPGAFSVKEPDIEHLVLEKYEEQPDSVMLVPGVAFSKEGYRIGYGAGFYDKYLAKHPSIYTIGVCFSEQVVVEIQPEIHDYCMSELVTERESRWKRI